MAIEERNYKIIAYIPNAEIRAVNLIEQSFEKNGKTINTSYIELKVDDENGDRIFLKDKCVDNLPNYKRGMIGTFTICLDIKEGFKGKTVITVRKFVEEN